MEPLIYFSNGQAYVCAATFSLIDFSIESKSVGCVVDGIM